MIYKPFKDLRVSWLGMGNMRLPTVAEKGPIDEPAARALIDYAYGQGVNYFDTAFRYHQGESELVVGRALKAYPRESFYLATKMPGHQMEYRNGKLEMTGYLTGFAISSIQEVFERQLEKCQVEYFDFYLLHNMSESSYSLYTNEELGVVDYLVKQKKAGRIRHLGFSSHGRAETIEQFLDWADARFPPQTFEVAQIQLNYLDWTLQNAGKKYEVLGKRGIPVIVMEGIRGGKLAKLGDSSAAILTAARPERSVASWAFRFLQGLPQVLTVLSGMTTMEQLRENLELFSRHDPLNDEEQRQLRRAVDAMASLVPCTGCRYCTEGCPQSLDIPRLISMYNEQGFAKNFNPGGLTPGEQPAACLNCGACSGICPQGIDVPGVLKQFAAALAAIPAA
ncbi:MAG: aldo/keto reductase [Spirochaetaceae bacterium]|jgi:predicted aldo/keto reductase-like oxidoreductase|nr:aldo/keto reductase [Spirochaetaceae bacterium]